MYFATLPLSHLCSCAIVLLGLELAILCLIVDGCMAVSKVMELIPSEKDGEPFEEAMARVRRCINGGGGQVGGDDDGSDSDLEVVAESITVNLRCPVRIKLKSKL